MDYKKNYNLVVVGGGLTGVACAISATDCGLTVLIIESAGYLGGAISQNLVFPFMPNSTVLTDSDGNRNRVQLSQGFFDRICREIKNVHYYRDEEMKLLLDQWTEQAGVDVLFHATLCGAKKDGSHIKSVSVATKSGILDFSADYFADCTGDADLCVYSGVSTKLGRESDNLCQPMTLCFRVCNVDKKRFYDNTKQMQELYKQWKADNRITDPREDILVFDYPMEGVLHFNTTRVVKLNPVNPFDVTKAEKIAREQIDELMRFFREAPVAGMEKAELIYSAPNIGVRESRMLDGEYNLTAEDLVGCARFDDAVAAGNYDIDIHNPEGSGTSHYYFPEGHYYTIPYRSLLPRAEQADNLIVGGRCISCTHEAQASIRIMPICATTGQAAGCAVATAKNRGSTLHNIDINALQTLIKEQGGFIG